MALHLVKLAVGAVSLADMEEWVAECLRLYGRQAHTTRMMPSRRSEVLDGGSLYWVIKGSLCCRQTIVDLDSVIGDDGIARCDIVLEPRLVPVEPRPRGPFQGWRYLPANEAPADLSSGGAPDKALPLDLQRELARIGVR